MSGGQPERADTAPEPWMDPTIQEWSQLLLNSFRRWTGRELIDRSGSQADQARVLYDSPCVVVSHGIEHDPVLNYGNRAALDLWEMRWEQLTQTPSRLTAEPVNQAERTRMLEQAATRGFIEDYQGVRVAASGRRFRVDRATVWNVLDLNGDTVGQAATFSDWTFIEPSVQP